MDRLVFQDISNCSQNISKTQNDQISDLQLLVHVQDQLYEMSEAFKDRGFDLKRASFFIHAVQTQC